MNLILVSAQLHLSASFLSHGCSALIAFRPQLLANYWHTAPSKARSITTSSSSWQRNADLTTSLSGENFLVQPHTDEKENEFRKSYLDDGFIYGLDGSGLERPKGREASVVVEGDSVETTPIQIGIVTATFAGHFYYAVTSVSSFYIQCNDDEMVTALGTFLTIAASWILADFGSGVFHWAVDNYGNGRTPVMGSIIAAFQGHHSAPWTITYRGFSNNVWKLCIPFGIPTIAAISYLAGPENPLITLFFAFFCATEIMSQELHKWSHMTKKETSVWINKLQDLGVIIARVPHAKHHLAPYDGNYCIVSGICNNALDKSGFFRFLEHKIYTISGVESNSWKLSPTLREQTLRGNYKQIPRSDHSKSYIQL